MRRVVSLWFPRFATDRLHRHGAVRPKGEQPKGEQPDGEAPKGEAPKGKTPEGETTKQAPLVTTTHDGRKRVLAAVDQAAAALGLHPGMTLAQARAMVPNLAERPATPEADRTALLHLAGWCLRYAPLIALDTSPSPCAPGLLPSGLSPSGLWIDITGVAHLFGGERRLLRDLLGRLAGQGLTAAAAVADTPGAAWAMARFGGDAAHPAIVPPGPPDAILAPLPIEALRLPADTADSLRLMGFERIGQLAGTPRAPLTRRFGALPMTRLDQALGRVFEPLTPLVPVDLPQARLAFVEPLLTADSLAPVIGRLAGDVCATLERAGLGARRLDLLFERVDGAVPVIRVGTARPSRDPRHLTRMLTERLERVDPGLGVEAMRLVVPLAEALAHEQGSAPLTEADTRETDIAPLIDRLANRLGSHRVYRIEPVESDVPERSARRRPPLATRPSARVHPDWSRPDWPRPVRLLDPPQPIEAMALLPDHPPVAFSWRRMRHRVRHADGPERIAGEWWKRDGETHAIRDYFRVEDEAGRRFWLFRRGDGEDPETGDMRWFLHGFF